MFSGKIQRLDYFGRGICVYVLLYIGSFIVDFIANTFLSYNNVATFWGGIYFVLILILLRGYPPPTLSGSIYSVLILILCIIWIYWLITTAKRFRDIGHNPWFCLIMLIPFINICFFVVLCILPSLESNRRDDT